MRLEIPARTVGIERMNLHGMAFMNWDGEFRTRKVGAFDPLKAPLAKSEPKADM